MKAQGMTWVNYVSEFQGTWSLRTRAVGQETRTSSNLPTYRSPYRPTTHPPTYPRTYLPTYLATSICLSNITDLCNSDPRIRRSGDDAPSRNRCGNNLKIARAVPVSSHELWHVVFGTKRGMTARTKIRTSRRNTYLTVTSLNELRTEKYEDEVRHLELKRHGHQQRTVQRNMTFEASQISYISVKRKLHKTRRVSSGASKLMPSAATQPSRGGVPEPVNTQWN